MKILLTAYGATALAFLAIDSVWLSTMAGLMYRPLLGDLLAPSFRLTPAILFYVIYVGGIVFFGDPPGLGQRSPRHGGASRVQRSPRRLRHIRPDQPRDATKLASDHHRRGHDLGNGADSERISRGLCRRRRWPERRSRPLRAGSRKRAR